jgi:hypothetical protein
MGYNDEGTDPLKAGSLQPRHPGHSGRSRYRKKLSGNISCRAFAISSGVAFCTDTISTSSPVKSLVVGTDIVKPIRFLPSLLSSSVSFVVTLDSGVGVGWPPNMFRLTESASNYHNK